MRPGKPLMHGRLGDMLVLGLPGNPVSSIVCGLLFVVPVIRALLGDPRPGADRSEPAILGRDLPANDGRAGLPARPDSRPTPDRPARRASPRTARIPRCSSSSAHAEALLVRAPHAPRRPSRRSLPHRSGCDLTPSC